MPAVTTFEALISGSTWNGDGITGRPVFITYSFETSPAAYLAERYTSEFLGTFQPLSAADQDIARQALRAWAEASGITLFEAPPGQGDIRFGVYDFSRGPEHLHDSSGFAFYPSVLLFDEGVLDSPLGGDIFIRTGARSFELFAHEIGHALGLKHPHEDDPTLDPSVDDLAHTVMTYNEAGGPATTLGSLDVEAIRHLYGPNSADGSQVASWSWNSSAYVLTQGGSTASDTIMGVGVRDEITGGEGHDYVFSRGGSDLIGGEGGDDTISAGDDRDTVAGGVGSDFLNGDGGDDSLSGGDGDDALFGFGGANTLSGEAGDDQLWGGPGFDRLSGGAGNDILLRTQGAVIADGGEGEDAFWWVLLPGTAGTVMTFADIAGPGGSLANIEIIGMWGDFGADTLVGGSMVDVLIGDAGADSLSGGDAANELFGDSGADTLSGGAGADYLEGGSGNDVIAPGSGGDVIAGGSGTDTVDYSADPSGVDVAVNGSRHDNGALETMTGVENLIGTAFADHLRGDSAANQLFGRGGSDTIVGGDGQNYLRGDEGDDNLTGGAHFDDINGNMGRDTAAGGLGGDWVVGGRDDDLLSGDDGEDIVYGNLGNDSCDGGAGGDIVRGGQGDDQVNGGSGADWLAGDRGDDTVSGGEGADVFHGHAEAGLDRIVDFNRADGDRIQLLPGATYTVAQSGADVIIEFGPNGRMVLVNVQLSSLTGDWIFGA